MAFGVTNLGVVLGPYPPNSEESPISALPCDLRSTLMPIREASSAFPLSASLSGAIIDKSYLL